MTPTILVTGSDHRLSLGLAAAIGVEAASVTGGATLLLEAGGLAQRRGATLLAAPGARGVEDSLRDLGLGGAARGHICHLALSEPELPMSEVAAAVEGSGAELAVIHLPGRLWVAALGAGELGAVGGCVLVSLPRERSLAALAVEELRRGGLRARVATRPPSAIAARRALAGIRAGGRSSVLAGRILRGLLDLERPSV